MTHEQANDPTVIKLAEPVVRVLKGLDVKCPCQAMPSQLKVKRAKERDDFRLVYQKEKRTIIPECHSCHNTGKEKWQWQPKVGEMTLFNDGSVHQVVMICWESPEDRRGQYLQTAWPYRPTDLPSDCVPILEWEEIERILERAGYSALLGPRNKEGEYFCWITGNKKMGEAWGKTRQEAVMRAVVRLGKESDTGNAT